MSSYRKVKAKIKESMKTGSGTDNIYKPEWPFYDIMAKFLDVVYKPRNRKTTITISDESEDDSKDECNESNQNLESSEEQDIAFKTPKIIPKKKCKLNETQNRMDEAYNYFKQLSQIPRKDVFSLYCDLLAEKLRGLQEHTRELAMLEIDKMEFNLKRQENE
ncbi:unnamed protein product [Parnassius mnemosyne]|uniref:MADF domain-containing protein n=1 Tax=Parnassius mnemosyne TaxID=213953 RepID=A0AAV1MAR1_9NEOP